MKIVKLQKDRLFSFLDAISAHSDLWAPVKKGDDKHVFEEIEDFTQIDLDYTRTILPPKKILLPPSINMFRAKKNGYVEDFSHVSEKIIFGIHSCDIHGLLILLSPLGSQKCRLSALRSSG